MLLVFCFYLVWCFHVVAKISSLEISWKFDRNVKTYRSACLQCGTSFFRVKPIMFSGAAVVVVVNSPYFFDKGEAASVNFVKSLSR